VLTPAANPLLSFPLSGGKAVETNPSASAAHSLVAHLTRRLAAGDEAAFREFHDQYFDRLYHFLLVVAHGSEQEAEEALQQTFLRLIRYVRVFESEEIFWSWLRVVARSAARDVNRKERRYSALLERFASCFRCGEPRSGSGEENRLSVALEESLAQLLPPDRRLLEAKYIEGLTAKELCAQTGATVKAIESRLERIRRAIRESVLKKISHS